MITAWIRTVAILQGVLFLLVIGFGASTPMAGVVNKEHAIRSLIQQEDNSLKLTAGSSSTVPIREIEGLTAYVRKNYPGTEGRENQISATLIDLDEEKDGENEILLAVEAMCGSGGCHYEILKRTGDGRLIALLGSTLCYDLRVGKGYTNGYRNLEVDVRVRNSSDDGWDVKTYKATYNGQHYE